MAKSTTSTTEVARVQGTDGLRQVRILSVQTEEGARSEELPVSRRMRIQIRVEGEGRQQ